ncbi:hypothetical protein BJX70DRAFT_400638 [Aspergillus crustosus]
MEVRGNPAKASNGRLAITRRSCDQCRSRKVTWIQSIMILNLPLIPRRDGNESIAESSGWETLDMPEGERLAHTRSIPLRDHSAHVIDFVKAVVDEIPIQSDSNEVTASLKSLMKTSAGSFLLYMFADHAVTYGDVRSRGYCDFCRSNLGVLLQRLPLILPASLEVIAALTFCPLNSVEQSKVTQSWALISSALSHCQTLGYHRLRPANGVNATDSRREAQERLFWNVFSYENGLSLRLGRQSGICDNDITLLVDPAEPRSIIVSRIQRKAYQHLYSAASVNEPAEDRIRCTWELSEELQGLINKTWVEISEASSQGDRETAPIRTLYLRADMVCRSSLLVLILRALPTNPEAGVDDCVTAARETLDLHKECMDSVRDCKDPLLVTKYITWPILHTPFVPFTILYMRAVQQLDGEDLARLDTFAASLKRPSPSGPNADTDTGTDTHSRLYDLLVQSAKMYIDSNLGLHDFSPSQFLDFGEETLRGGEVDAANAVLFGAGDWYYGSQLMGVLDDVVHF